MAIIKKFRIKSFKNQKPLVSLKKISLSFGKRQILDNISFNINKGIIPVVTGFQGMNDNGDITTLGRGGSDTTGVALAVAIEADECHIYTDVDGIFTTDPRICTKAKLLKRISFEEMLELSSTGSKVLQLRAVEYASKNKMPIRVLSSFSDSKGTLVEEGVDMEKPIVSGIKIIL